MSTFTSEVRPQVLSMMDVFKDNNFRIPFYQRDYSWGNDEVGDFWDDLMDVFNNNQNNHFFGQLVTFEHADVQDLIDGQQRVTTSTIFMSAVFNIASDIIKNNKLSDDPLIDLKLLQRSIQKSIRQNSQTPALVLQAQSKSSNLLQNYLIGLFSNQIEITDEYKNIEPIKNINNAYNQLYQYVQTLIKSEKTINGRINALNQIFNSFCDKFYVSMITAPNRQDAFIIFETLNSRGKDLAPSDIIKTHLMSLSSSQSDEQSEDEEKFQNKWNFVSNRLSKNSNSLTKFIRSYWSASHKLVMSRQLYRSISNYITTKNEAESFLDDLKELVDLYNVLNSPRQTKNNLNYLEDSYLTDMISILRSMQVKLYYPIMLAMYRRGYNPSDMRKVIRKVLCIFVRHRMICNDGTNKLETGFSNVAQDIWNQNTVDVNDIIGELNQHLLKSSSETKANFNVLQKEGGSAGAKRWSLTYLLFKLYQVDQHSDFESNSMYDPDINLDGYKLIRIGNDEVADEYQNYIGNWTLIEPQLSNIKKIGLIDALKRSDLNNNKYLAQYIKNHGNQWTVDDIQSRQQEFSELATMIW
ncbi:hypothetical protein WR164_01760 [Philodulcilactobacillus myokoensis]|uniref:GmrSD restriction endonucleases N-terminal domain-containing protein n=1 Tax=Philodulcilactobacillus myokoensis TaxID=2929573 RepID=A0A9W6AZK7_9LACO|nr:DUF262 domain-containing protein [Philodulcilactobacillus myokoensis]GLB46197.1 hypothetical protein WR164_01760 [Philodulcilactobacillus myokoensis]